MKTDKKAPKSKVSKINNFGILSREDKVTTIYIGNMSFNKDEFAIKKLFSKYGKVTYIRLVRDTKTLKSKGFAFVQMPNQVDATRAIEKLNGMIVDERTLKVSVAQNNEKKVPSVKAITGETISTQAPEVSKTKVKRRNKVRGLDLLFQNTKK